MKKVKLTMSEQIDRAKDGRTQVWIIKKMNDMGCSVTDVTFTRKKKEIEKFNEQELTALKEILGVEIEM